MSLKTEYKIEGQRLRAEEPVHGQQEVVNAPEKNIGRDRSRREAVSF